MKLPKLKRIKVENDRLEEIKEEFKQWKKEQRKWKKEQSVKQVGHDDDKLEWYCYVVPILLVSISLILLLASFWWS